MEAIGAMAGSIAHDLNKVVGYARAGSSPSIGAIYKNKWLAQAWVSLFCFQEVLGQHFSKSLPFGQQPSGYSADQRCHTSKTFP